MKFLLEGQNDEYMMTVAKYHICEEMCNMYCMLEHPRLQE